MLSIAPLHSQSTSYYFSGPEYSLKDTWLGAGARDLGLQGSVDPAKLDALFSGRSPVSHAEFENMTSRTRVVNYGYDAVFSAPKSVSLLALLGEPNLAQRTRQAHQDSVEKAFEFFESQICCVRRASMGHTSYIRSNGVIAGQFSHCVTRALDPHLHTHVVFPNLTRGEDNRWSAFNSAFIWASARTSGFLYQANLRHELTKQIGVEWRPLINGTSEINGIPRELLESFSIRSKQIETFTARTRVGKDENSSKSRRFAGFATRTDKPPEFDLEQLAQTWTLKAESLGFSQRDIDSVLHRTDVPPISRRFEVQLAARVATSPQISRSEYTLYRSALNAACEITSPGVDPACFESAARSVVSSPLIRAERNRLVPNRKFIELRSTNNSIELGL